MLRATGNRGAGAEPESRRRSGKAEEESCGAATADDDNAAGRRLDSAQAGSPLLPVALRAAVVGLGWWGRTVVASLADSSAIHAVLGVDPVEANRQAMLPAELDTSAQLDTALADPSIDAVILCTPHRLHCEQVVAAARAGKHVFCEKPFSMRVDAAAEALEAVEAAGVRLGIGHERRFEPAIGRLQEACRAGELGTPLVLEGNFSQDKFLALPADSWRLSATDAPAGPLSATGIHLVDIAISLFGWPTQAYARLATLATGFANGDTLTLTLGFEGGATASLTAVLTTPFLGRVCLLGSQGWMEIRDRSHPEEPQGWDVTTVRRGTDPQVDFYPPHASVRANLERFAAAITDGVDYPITLDEVRANAACIEAILRSVDSGQVEEVRR